MKNMDPLQRFKACWYVEVTFLGATVSYEFIKEVAEVLSFAVHQVVSRCNRKFDTAPCNRTYTGLKDL